MMKIIDPHLHLFDLEQGDYQWLKAENPPFWSDKKIIASNFAETDLQLSSPFELAGFVHIEAGFDNSKPWREIAWLEETCSLPFRSIAGINLLLPSNEFQQVLDKLVVNHPEDKRIQQAVSEMLEGTFSYKNKIRARNLNKRGIKQVESGSFTTAIDTFKSALTETPKHPGLNLNLIQTLLKTNQQSPLSQEDIKLCELCIERTKHITNNHQQYKRFIKLSETVCTLSNK